METYRILAQGQTVSNDTWATGLNTTTLSSARQVLAKRGAMCSLTSSRPVKA